MNPDLLADARDALEGAQGALSEILRLEPMGWDKHLRQTRREWETLLVNGNRVLVKLQQASKGRGDDAAWFGRKKHERNSDELLTYLYQARHALEHGLTRVADVEGGKAHFTAPSKAEFLVHHSVDENGNIVSVPGNKQTKLIASSKSRVALAAVHNHGLWYVVPGNHLGHPLSNPTLASAGKAYISWLKATLDEAQSRIDAEGGDR